MYIRRYGELPGLYVPPVGEVVIASRSRSGPFHRAVITSVRRRARETVRIDFVWLEDSGPTLDSDGCRKGDKGHVDVCTDGTGAEYIRRLPKVSPPAQDASGESGAA